MKSKLATLLYRKPVTPTRNETPNFPFLAPSKPQPGNEGGTQTVLPVIPLGLPVFSLWIRLRLESGTVGETGSGGVALGRADYLRA